MAFAATINPAAVINADWRKRMSRRRFQHPQPKQEWGHWYIIVREDFQQPGGKIERKQVRVRLGPVATMNFTQAERAADQYVRRINSTSYRPRTGLTFQEFAVKWMDTCLKPPHFKPSSIPATRSGINKHLLPALGELELAEIGPEHMDGLISAAPLAPKSVRNLMFTLKAISKKAVAWGYLQDDANWFRGIDLPTGERGKGRVFSAENVRLILRNADEPYRTFYWVIAETGMRAGEASGLRWDDIDLVNRTIEVHQAMWQGKLQSPKTEGSKRVFPITAALAAALADLQKTGGWPPVRRKKVYSTTRYARAMCSQALGVVFVGRRGSVWSPDLIVKRKLHPLLRRLSIPPAGLHAFRHALGTEWLRSGVDIKTVQAQLGHTSASTTLDFYAHAVTEDRRRAVEAWSKTIRPQETENRMIDTDKVVTEL